MDQERSTTVVREQQPQVVEPTLYKVLLHNDDFTPMDFVVSLIQTVFHKSKQQSTDIMLSIHNKGVGLCGVFTLEIARTKVFQVERLAEKYEHPLRCTIEESER